MASYPSSVYSPRTRENKSGVVYDANKKTVIFVEDLNNSDAEIVAIEQALGKNYTPTPFRFNLVDPKNAYAVDHEFCVAVALERAVHIKRVRVSCDANPTTEPTGDVKYADTFLGLANSAVISAFDTTDGAFDSGAINVAVASGKCIYFVFDAEPDAALTQMCFQIEYTND